MKPRFLNSLQAFEKNLQASTPAFDPRNPLRAALDADRDKERTNGATKSPCGRILRWGQENNQVYRFERSPCATFACCRCFTRSGVEYQRGAGSLREVSALWERRMRRRGELQDTCRTPSRPCTAFAKMRRDSSQRSLKSREKPSFSFSTGEASRRRGLTELGIDGLDSHAHFADRTRLWPATLKLTLALSFERRP